MSAAVPATCGVAIDVPDLEAYVLTIPVHVPPIQWPSYVQVAPGFAPSGVLMASLDVFPAGYDADRGRLFYSQLIEPLHVATDSVHSEILIRMVTEDGRVLIIKMNPRVSR